MPEPSTFSDAQQGFLASQRLLHDPQVVDCDPEARTITFEQEGIRATRRVCEVYSRVMGYHRAVEFWNNGKQQEHKDRRFFKEMAMLH